jgi:hypothetical protein
MSAGQWGSTRATKWETHVFRAALERIVACAPAISRVSFSFSDSDERLSQSAPRRRWRQARRRAPSMAASLDPATQAGIGAFAGLVEVTAQQVRRAACLRRNLPRAVSERPTNRRFPSPTRLRSPQIARREASGARTRRTRRRVIRVAAHDVLTRSTRPRGRPLTVSSPPKNTACAASRETETKKTAPAHVEELRAGRAAAPSEPHSVVPRVDRGRPDVRPDDRRAVRGGASAREALRD